MTDGQELPVTHADNRPQSLNVRERIAYLETASRDELTEAWRKVYRSDPPKGASQRLLFGAVAHALQMRALGLSATKLSRRLERVGKRPESARAPRPALMPGARLIREWNGSSHTVEVVADGYVWNGERYRSLSAIARAITGTRWSGPRFFGLDPESTT